jgi:predicted dehydrogenase
MLEKIKWGLIGYGKFAKKIESSFEQTKIASLNYIASKSFINHKKDKLLTNYNNKIIYSSYKDLINDKKVQNIYITTTNNLHKELIIDSANNGKNIICEKPACTNEKDFSECIDAIKKNNVFFMEGLMYLHHPQIAKSIEIIKKGEIGKIKKIIASFGYRVGKKFLFFELKKIDRESRIFNPKLGGGSIYDLGCYPLTASLLFFNLENNNQIINYEFNRNDGRYGVDENADAKLYFSCGGQAEISVSIRKDLENTIEIFGSKGKIKIFYPWLTLNDSTIELQKGKKKVYISNYINKNIYALEIEKASNAIIQNKKEIDFPGANIKQSLEYIKILEKWKSANI